MNRRLKKLLIRIGAVLLVLFLFGLWKKANTLDFQTIAPEIESLVIYDTTYPNDVRFATSGEFPKGLANRIFPEIRVSHAPQIWKGHSLGILKRVDGTKYELKISYSGSFFTVEGKSGYYYFEGQERDLFEDAKSKIFREVFIPARRERNN